MPVTTFPDNITSLEALAQALPATSLYGADTAAPGTGWLLACEPFALSSSQHQQLIALGDALMQFARAADHLYQLARKDETLAWVRHILEAGKPQSLLTFAQMNRFKHHLPLVIRPDLLVTETGFALTEIDAVPGGIGFLSALSHAYQTAGFPVLQPENGIPQAFLQMLIQAANVPNNPTPTIAVIVSDEAGDYRAELQFLVDTLQPDYPNIHLVHPKAITLEHHTLGFTRPDGGFEAIHIVYRFFELFDLPNIPQIELIQYAVKKGLVYATPPFKPWLEEKLMLGLFHLPGLQSFWEKQLSPEALSLLKTIIPETWILDPAPVPAFATVTPALTFGGQHFHTFSDLAHLTQKQRELVIKPSGFSPLAWGSRGVVIGHDHPQDTWETALQEALAQGEITPHVMQRYEKPQVHPYRYFHPQSGEVIESQGRTRLCPYYFVYPDRVDLVGVLATTCPKDKKIIHGMQDGALYPARVLSAVPR